MILFVDNESVWAALTMGASRNTAALFLVCLHWATAAQYDIAIQTERIPTQMNPADVPSRAGQLFFDTEPSEDLASLYELFAICDCSRALSQHAT